MRVRFAGASKEVTSTVLEEFKKFAMRGNVLDMAVGIIIGAAFGAIVTSFVNDLLMPPIGRLLGNVDFSNLFINLSGQPVASLKAAKDAGLATINYGLFFNAVLNFLIVAFAVFLLIRQVNRMTGPAQAQATRDCPYCLMSIPIKATRCAHCTSEVRAA